MGVLNPLHHFFIPALSPAMFNVVTIVFAFAVVPFTTRLGVEPIMAIAISTTLGGVAQLALQWPTSRDILQAATEGAKVSELRFFGWMEAKFAGGFSGLITRTGFTGDLGYEVWVENAHALALWSYLGRSR